MNSSHNCPICKTLMMEDKYTFPIPESTDLICRQDNHFFVKRISPVTNQVSELKIKLQCGEEELYLKINYNRNYTDVWATANNSKHIRIPYILMSDFEDFNKIKHKIKTCLLFS